MPRISKTIEMKLIQNITNGIYQEGSYLPSERKLAESFNVSRSIIREAIFGLQARGYVLLKPSFRPIVSRPSLSHILSELHELIPSSPTEEASQKMAKNIGQIRRMLEQEASIELSLYGSDKNFFDLQQALQKNKEAQNDFGLFQQTDIAFHKALLQGTQNDILITAHTLLSDWLMHFFTKENVRNKSVAIIIEQHERIVEAIFHKDLEEIREAIKIHLLFYQHNIGDHHV